MKTRLWQIIPGIAVLLFFSCNFYPEKNDFDLSGGKLPPGQFWAENMSGTARSWYKVDAELLWEGVFCSIWAEKGADISAETAEKIAFEYDEKIYPGMIEAFSFEEDILFNGKSMNIIEYTDYYLTGGDGKLTILFLNINDGYDPENDRNSYIAGYFWAINFFENIPRAYYRNSNECAMLYIDIKIDEPGSSKSYETIAHELQHLMNFGHSLHNRSTDRIIFSMDTWIDEGLSGAAEWVYSRTYNEGRLDWYNDDISGLISQGNNFFVWGNRTDESVYAVLDDYATVYLFFQWLRIQSGGGTGIYKNIITSDKTNYRAVLDAWVISDWESLLRYWLAANYINAPEGPYGYRSQLTLTDAKTFPGPAPLSLFPGEGVYSLTSTVKNIPTTGGPNIKYASLSKSPPDRGNVSTTGHILSNIALLTYNINTVISGPRETGTLASVGMETIQNAGTASGAVRSLMIPLSGPYAISAGDLLRQNGHNDSAISIPTMGEWNRSNE
ncbi:MAG: hypothetical protein FWG89_06555 [Treponema sp.]|nr:hypothetical protein [Treponema sp.]